MNAATARGKVFVFGVKVRQKASVMSKYSMLTEFLFSVNGGVRLRSKFLVLTGITLAFMGVLSMLALEDLSHQFFRQEIRPWMNFSLVLVVLGIALIAAWYFSTISSS